MCSFVQIHSQRRGFKPVRETRGMEVELWSRYHRGGRQMVTWEQREVKAEGSTGTEPQVGPCKGRETGCKRTPWCGAGSLPRVACKIAGL